MWGTAEKDFYILPLDRDRQIQIDIEPIIDQLQARNFIGDQISGIDLTVFKVRAKNSDIPTGKSGGYRAIYQVVSPKCILSSTPRVPGRFAR